MSYHDLHFVIDGRCDGLLFHDGEVIVDEIKSISQPLEGINGEGYPVHWAQAKMYAFMYCKDRELSEITVQLTYVHVELGDKKYYKKSITFLELESFAYKMVEGYAPYAGFKQKHHSIRNESIKALNFPFEKYRTGQRKMAGAGN